MIKLNSEEMIELLKHPQKGDVIIRFVLNDFSNRSIISLIEDYDKYSDDGIYGIGVTLYNLEKKSVIANDGYGVYFFPLETYMYSFYFFRGENLYYSTGVPHEEKGWKW